MTVSSMTTGTLTLTVASLSPILLQKRLLSSIMDIRASISPPEWDLLLSAAQKNNADLIREMVASGVDPSHSNGVGQSALHIAALWGNVEAVEALLQAGADCNAANRIMGSTPLHMAAQSNKGTTERMTATVDLLLQHGANSLQVDSSRSIPFEYATIPEIKKKLEPKAFEIYQVIASADLKQLAAILENADETLDLNGASFNNQTLVDWTVEKLLAAADDPQKPSLFASMLHELFDKGARSSQETTCNLVTALERAFVKDSAEDVGYQELLEQVVMASLQHQQEGATPSTDTCLVAHQAARRGNIRMLQFMVERLGMDPNLGNRQQMTPLHFAARSGQVHAVQYLLSLEASPTGAPRVDAMAKDSLGQTAIDAARKNNKLDVVALLEEQIIVA